MVKMKAVVGAVVALLLVGAMWPHASHAVTLTIEGGFIVTFGDPADTVYSFGGADFTVQGLIFGHWAGFGALTSGVSECPLLG